MSALIIIPLLLLSSVSSLAQPAAFAPDRMSSILYGVAYYPEDMPYERLDKDVEMMQKARITVVRMGESSWGLWEPQDGHFEFAWMDRVIDRMRQAGIKVILGTPTYSIPAWLYKEHPEITITTLGGEHLAFGTRQNTDLLNATYRYYCERVIRKIAEHYKNNQTVIGYQIDNETSAGGAANQDVQAEFVKYLQRKFETVDQLNKIWGLNYWGQRLNDWSEIPPEEGIINPGWKLEWQRYSESLVTDFLTWQASIINEYKRPEQFVTHDFSMPPRAEVNELDVSHSLDIVASNPYYDTQDLYDGAQSSLMGDYARCLKQTNYLVTETNAQTTGSDSKEQFPPYDGQLRLEVYTDIANGANMVEYWHWHSLHYGHEMYWKGVLSHDLEPNPIYAEVSRTAHELERIGPEVVDFKRQNKVAILYSNDSRHGLEFMRFSDHVDYASLLNQMYLALYRQNVGVDFIFPETPDLSQYKVIVAPLLYVASDNLLNRLVDYVSKGGHLVITFKSGFTNEYDSVRSTMAPGPLRKAAGFRYQEFSSLTTPIALKGDPFKVGNDNLVSDWMEMLILEGANALAYYDHPFFGKYPAITRNTFGRGTLTYEGTVLSDAIQTKVLRDVLQVAGLASIDQRLPGSIRVKHGTNRSGKMIHYFLNYSPGQQTFKYNYAPGEDLLTQRPIASSQSVTLNAWDLAIVEENIE